MPFYGRLGYRRRGSFGSRRYRSRFPSAKVFRSSRRRPSRNLLKLRRRVQWLKRMNFNWTNQAVENYPSVAFWNLFGENYQLEADGYHSRTLVYRPRLDDMRLLFRGYFDGANPARTMNRLIIDASTAQDRRLLQNFRIKSKFHHIFKLPATWVNGAGDGEGAEVVDIRMQPLHVYCYIVVPRSGGNPGDDIPDNAWLKGANTNLTEGLKQGVDWDVRQSVVGAADTEVANQVAPIINFRRWKLIKRKVLTFMPGQRIKKFHWKWTYKPKDMCGRGFTPTTAHEDFWDAKRMPRLFLVCDALIGGVPSTVEPPFEGLTVLEMAFNAVHRVFLGAAPGTTATDQMDPPGDQPVAEMDGVAPAADFPAEP